MKQKKIPLRKCVITGEQYPKKELIRVVKNKAGEVFVDETGKANGRGAYLKLSKAVINKAIKTKKLDKHLGIAVPEEVYDKLKGLVEQDES